MSVSQLCDGSETITGDTITGDTITGDTINSEGWQACLQLGFETSSVKTIMRQSKHYGPLRVQRPFYPEGDVAHVYILHPPGGVVGGDQLTIEIDVHENARVLCTSPGSAKFYLSAGPWAQIKQHFQVKPGGSLEWMPQENILFSGARVRARTRIELQDDATFIGWDISCLGRPASKERFIKGAFDSRLELYHNQKLIMLENQRVFEAQKLDAAAGLRGKPLQATLLAFPCNEHHLEKVRSKLSELGQSNLMAVTLIDGLLVLRALGESSEMLKNQLIQIWQVLRPMMLKRLAVLPRIWAT